VYEFTAADSGPANTHVGRVGPKRENTAFSNSGIEFFTEHSMMLDYDSGKEGWQ
jgi:hypothetical protein